MGVHVELIAAAHPIVHVNALLNATAAALLVLGFVLIKRHRVDAHKRTMLAAFSVSTLFLACYLWYHYQVGSVKFTAPSMIRYVYYAILVSHVLLAFAVPPLAIWTIYLGLRATGFGAAKEPTGQAFSILADYRNRHMRWARWTFPIWLYVSVTGVVVYVMLYHLWPPVDL
jgi:uncharacterized membrane protein YozB (DUF420 family)